MTSPEQGDTVRPWSPYPVQDWSRLPEDPLAAEEVRYTRVDPGWTAPPRDRRPGWLPLAAVVVVLAVVAGGIYAANLVGTPRAGSGAARFAPAEGVVAYDTQTRTTGAASSTTTVITEQARYLGPPGLQSLDWALATQVLGQTSGRLESVHFWRSLSTTVGSTAGTGQNLTMREVGRDITLLAEAGATTSYAYSPGLVELPVDVQPGSSWSSEGTAGKGLRYASTFSAEAGEQGCLQVRGTITYTTSSGSTIRAVTLDRTWCEGAGVVVELASEGGTTTTRGPRAGVAPDTPPTADATHTWSSPAGWQRRDFAAVTVDPTFGEGVVGGTPSPVPAVITSSGIVFRVSQQARDVVGFVPKTAATWRQAVRMHPGGTVLALASFGRVIVATTSEREVVAYDDQGARLWQLGLSELVPRPPVRVDDGAAALVSVAGEVLVVDLASGGIRWQHAAGADVSAALAVGDGVVVVLDRSGNATALEQADGSRRWQVDLESSAAAVDDGLLVGIADQTLEGVDLADGRRRWVRPFRGIFERVTPFAARFVVESEVGTLAVDHDGRRTPVGPPYLSSLRTPDYFFGWADGRTEVLDTALRPVTTWLAPEETIGSPTIIGLPYAQGIVVTTSRDWSIQTRSDEP